MDAFMDKLAQKLTAQEIIKGNLAAEADEMNHLKAEVNEYRKCLQDIKQVATEVSDKLTGVTDENNEKIKKALEDIIADANKKIESANVSAEEVVHKECVKVYRNVQACVEEETGKAVETLQIAVDEAGSKSTAALVFSIIGMLASLGAVALLCLQMFF